MRALAKIAVQAATLVLAVLVWEFLVEAELVDPLFVPAPSRIAADMPRVLASAVDPMIQTLTITLSAFLIGSGIGVFLGVVIGSRELVYRVSNPYILGLYSLPRIIFLPLIIFFMGIGVRSILFYAVFHTVLPVLMVTIGGVRDIDRSIVRYAKSLGLRGLRMYTKVIIPAALPSIMGALRLGIIFSLLGTLIGEMYLSLSGLGFLMQKLSYSFKSSELFAVVFLVSVVSISLSVLLGWIGKRLEEKRGEVKG